MAESLKNLTDPDTILNPRAINWNCNKIAEPPRIDRTAPKPWVIHKLRANAAHLPRNRPPIAIGQGSRSATHPKPCNADAIFCNPGTVQFTQQTQQSPQTDQNPSHFHSDALIKRVRLSIPQPLPPAQPNTIHNPHAIHTQSRNPAAIRERLGQRL